MAPNRIALSALLVCSGSLAWAQEGRVELSGTAGWTFSDGASGDSRTIPGVGTFNRVDPKDAFSWSARIGFFATEDVEVGGLFGMQLSSLELGGAARVTVGDLNVYNYHGYFAYHFGDEDDRARPYVLGGAGATQFGSVAASVGAVQRNINGLTKFSTTWALGVKLFPNDNAGIRIEGRWTPTYIKSDAAGWWCDPFWGCYVVGSAQYANQFELSGGLTLRF
jgi:opacity protein-like surface antigen